MIYRTGSHTRMIAESEYSKLVEERDESRRQLSHCKAANNKHRSERDAARAACDQAISDLQGVCNYSDNDIVIDIAQHIAANLMKVLEEAHNEHD